MSSDDSDEEEFKDETSTSTRPVNTSSTVQRGDTSSKPAAAAADNWDNESGNDSGNDATATATATGRSGAGS
eukprot:21420-Heterococcus_DN1.PRE.4